MANNVPAKAAEVLPVAIPHAEADAEPCGQKAAAVLLLDLWAVFPLPASATADRIWCETLAQYPADLVKGAIAQLIATRTWDRDAPVPGQVVALLKGEHAERVGYLAKLQAMQSRVKLQAKPTKPPGPLMRDQPKEDREAFLAKMREKYPDGFRQAEASMSEPEPSRAALD